MCHAGAAGIYSVLIDSRPRPSHQGPMSPPASVNAVTVSGTPRVARNRR